MIQQQSYKQSNKNKSKKMSRQFFNSNKIQNFKTFTPQKSETSINRHFHTTQKLKRVTSCRDTTTRLNPQKFINREVFNSKLYSAKPFNIAVEFNKQSQEKIHKMYSFEDNENVENIQRKIRKQAKQEFASGINNLSHFFRTVHKEIDSQGSNNGSIKRQMILLKEGFDKILKILCKEIEYFEDSYVKLMFAQKSGQKLQNLSYRIQDMETSKLLTQRKGVTSSRKLLESSFHNNLANTQYQKSWMKPSTSSSLRTSRIIQQNVPNSNQLKTLTSKLNLIEFENKKHVLRIQSLENEKRLNEEKITQLQKKIDQMSDKIAKVNETEDFYNYKIKKLKEELEVAHIVKEQNLAEKMRYILQQ